MKNPDTGRRDLPPQPESEWIRTDVPGLRIVPQELWDAAKARQDHLTGLYTRSRWRAPARASAAASSPMAASTPPTGRARSCPDCCSAAAVAAPMSGAARTAMPVPTMCSSNGCDNTRTIGRKALEARVLAGLRDRLMAPETAAEAMRAYAQETNRLNRERRTSGETTRRELADTEKAIQEIVHVIEQGGYHRALSARLTELEARQDELSARLSEAPADLPDIHPISATLPAQDRAFDRSAQSSRRCREAAEASAKSSTVSSSPWREARRPPDHPAWRSRHHPRMGRRTESQATNLA